jgi:hypothetical protein|tara:strand:- start:270 stop:488 length:219 start_codon:yes stop_codon:yes gene_type:complete
MNIILSIAAIANPIITATLTILFYLERKKLEERNIALQKKLNESSQLVSERVIELSNSLQDVKNTLEDSVNI